MRMRRIMTVPFSFPRSAWERKLGRSASRLFKRTRHSTRSVPACVPTQSVGTRSQKAIDHAFELVEVKRLRNEVGDGEALHAIALFLKGIPADGDDGDRG